VCGRDVRAACDWRQRDLDEVDTIACRAQKTQTLTVRLVPCRIWAVPVTRADGEYGLGDHAGRSTVAVIRTRA